jgi:hypothetical protein
VNRISDSNIGGTKLVDVNTAALTDGTIATVFSVGALFRLVKTPTAALTATVDGITVVASTASPGSIWVRIITTSDERFVANIPIFIDPVAGSDDNDGLALGTALKTADEWCRRMNGQVFRNALGTVTVTCLPGNVGSFEGCKLIATQNVAAGSIFIKFFGSVSQSVAVGTVSSIVAQNIATQTEYQFTDSSGVGPVIAANSRLRLVGSATAANIGAVGFVRGFAAGGATNPFTSAWIKLDGSEIFPAAGDTYVVETLLTTMITTTLAIEMNSLSRCTPSWTDFVIGDPASSLPGIAPTTTDTVANVSHPFFQTCQFVQSTLVRLDAGNLRFVGCEFVTRPRSDSRPAGTHSFESGIFRAGCQLNTTCSFLGNVAIEAASSIKDCSNAGNVLLSRILAGTGLTISNGGYYAAVVGTIWSPVIGARNGMATGLFVASTSRVQVNSFAVNLASLSATVPFSANGRTVPGTFYTDLAVEAAYSPTATADGFLAYWRNLSVAPTVNPVLAAFEFAASGGLHARGSGGSIGTVTPFGGAAAGHANLAGVKWSDGPVNTVNVVTSNIVTTPSLATPGISGAIDNAGFDVEGTLVGIDGANNVISIKVARSFKRIAGVLTALGAATTVVYGPIGDAALVATVGLLVAVGNTIVLQATGVAATTIAWNGFVKVWSTDYVG